MKKLVCIASICFASLTSAQELLIKGDTQLASYHLVILESSVDLNNKYPVWHVSPSDNVDKRILAGKLVFTAPPGVYLVELTVIDFDKKTGADVAIKVTIGGDLPNPPAPNPPVQDAFTQALQMAYTSDTALNKASALQRLIIAFKDSLSSTDDSAQTTVGGLRNMLVSNSSATMQQSELIGVRKLVSLELDNSLGTKANTALTPDIRAKVKTAYNRIIAALSQVK